MKKKRKIDMYDPQIYPRKLWVAVGPEELDEQFKFYLTDKSGVIENIDEEFEQEGIAMSTYSVGWAAGCISKTIIKEKQNDI